MSKVVFIENYRSAAFFGLQPVSGASFSWNWTVFSLKLCFLNRLEASSVFSQLVHNVRLVIWHRENSIGLI